MTNTYYHTLEISPHASKEVIRAAYRALITKYHPDKHPGDDSVGETCVLINKAYETLSDPTKKQQYDLSLKIQPTFTQPSRPAPPPPPEPPVRPYVYDPKWEKFLSERDDWAKRISPPAVSWSNEEPPIQQVPGGFVNVRPDLEMWGEWIIRTGKLNNISFGKVRDELIKTWSYFTKDSGWLTESLIRVTAEERCNKAYGRPSEVKVQFGL